MVVNLHCNRFPCNMYSGVTICRKVMNMLFSWQFFLTYRSCKHLDGKHSVFGRVVGGAETTLSAMERVGTDNKDRPVEDIVIEKAQVFVDPFEEVDEQVITKQLNTSVQRPPLKNTRNYGPSGLRCSLRLQEDIIDIMYRYSNTRDHGQLCSSHKVN